MDVSEKNYVDKCLLKMFLTGDEGVKTLIKISVRIFLTLLIVAVGWALCGRPQPEHESVIPLLSLSLLNVLTH